MSEQLVLYGIDSKEWESKSRGQLFIAETYFHHHAFEIINTYPIVTEVLDKLEDTISISTSIRTKKGVKCKGIKAHKLNKEIRHLLSDYVKFEVNEIDGVFYYGGKKIGGFDFGLLDERQNLLRLWNLCFGTKRYSDGKKRWKKFLKIHSDLESQFEAVADEGVEGSDFQIVKTNRTTPLIMGEIQFGNWGLVYADFFKVLKANVHNSVDCMIYIVATGDLENYLSDGIVTYSKTVALIKEFAKVISVPIYVLGVDIKSID